MSLQPLVIVNAGMVSSVGLSAPAACAAIRAGLTNPSETRFVDSDGERILGHAVPLPGAWRGRAKLVRMAANVIEECLGGMPREDWSRIPLLLCVAEQSRPGRLAGLDDFLLQELWQFMGMEFARESRVIPHGHVSIAVALLHARRLVYEGDFAGVLIVGTDSLLTWPVLRSFGEQERLLSNRNSNGFIPGEGASGVLVCRTAAGQRLRIEGLGFATESAHIASEEPLRADGLTKAIRAALSDAMLEMGDLDFRIADISGEQYYFKEAAVALSRTLRVRKDEFDLWHPAESMGEVGSAIGPALLAVANVACLKAYAAGRAILVHTANDAGERAAIITRYAAN